MNAPERAKIAKGDFLIALFFMLILSTHNTLLSHSVYIIVHGTWSANTAWYAPGGDFFDTLEKVAQKNNAHVAAFRWCGSNTHKARQKAAQNLAKLIQTYPLDTHIYLIGHSHGGNVCTLASQLLAQDMTNKHRITIFFALGTPIYKKIQPSMTVIDYVYNLFSFEDLIQPVFALFDREYQTHERIANLRLFLNNKEPDHTNLHHPIVAQWIPFIHEKFVNYLNIELKNNNLSLSTIIYLCDHQEPRYIFDEKRQELLERDIRLSLMMLNTLQASFDRKKQINNI